MSPVVNFNNILQVAFSPIFFCQNLEGQSVIRDKLQKAACKMMMKLSPEV
jgi:hypothetical protein